MVSWNLNTMRFVSVIGHPNRSSSDKMDLADLSPEVDAETSGFVVGWIFGDGWGFTCSTGSLEGVFYSSK